MSSQDSLATQLRALHVASEPIVFCNVWDAASARAIAEEPAAKAIATASWAVAATQGIADDDMTLEQNLRQLHSIVPVVKKYGKPVTVDLQDGYGDDLERAIESIIDLGAVGCNLEDFDRRTNKLFSFEAAVKRVRLVLATAERKGVKNFALNARTDVLFKDLGSVDEAAERGKAYIEAGATSAFVPGASTEAQISTLVKELDGKLNAYMTFGPGALTLQDLRRLGVSRVSIGPALFARAMKTFADAAKQMLTT